jgi:hypothetical protein
MKRDIKEVVKHYLAAVMFTEDLGDKYELTDFSSSTVKGATELITKFLDDAEELLTEEWTDEQIGHDIWLTRCGHGAGFWDRDLPNGDELTTMCEAVPFHGMVYVTGGAIYIDQ